MDYGHHFAVNGPLPQDELEDKTNLQEALIKSEELRLALANTLVSTQVRACAGITLYKWCQHSVGMVHGRVRQPGQRVGRQRGVACA